MGRSLYRKICLLGLDLILALGTNFMVLMMVHIFSQTLSWLNFSICDMMLHMMMAMVIYGVGFIGFRLYDSLWRYAGPREFVQCLLCALLIGVIYTLGMYLIGSDLPFYLYVITALMVAIEMVMVRLLYRQYRSYILFKKQTNASEKIRILLVGAGAACEILLNELLNNSKNVYLPVCAVDDSLEKKGRVVKGIKIVGTIDDIESACMEYAVDEIFVCIPSATKGQLNRILGHCQKTSCKIRMIPDVYTALEGGKSMVSKFREVRIEDLLGRESISLDNSMVGKMLEGKTILVTGGGGSIGSELCRQMAGYSIKKLIILDIYENNAYDVEQELKFKYQDRLDLVVEIASIRDDEKLAQIFAIYKPNIIFHAAAHKHVPLMEHNPEEAIKNNIFGTRNVAELAMKHGTERFVLISTDKAVNPTSVMGATKRFTEMLIETLNGKSATKFVAVRFGNVIGSNGSVIPLFKKQIKNGGPLTVTHRDIIRYFMTIPEAVQLVLQAGAMTKGGEIFILDMGEPVSIFDMAEKMIKLSGHELHKEIDIKIVGLRPGEKLYEELLMSEEGMIDTENKKIFVAQLTPVSESIITESLLMMQQALKANDQAKLIQGLKHAVQTYVKPSEDKRVG